MAECAFCKIETPLHMSGIPMCLQCAEAQEVRHATLTQVPLTGEQVRKILLQDLSETTFRVKEASVAFDAVVSSIPSKLPQPDGIQRIKNASNELSITRREMMRAHARLNDFLNRGLVPEDLHRRKTD